MYISGDVERLLNNDRFVLWCIAPDEKSDVVWNAWIHDDPKNKLAADEARRIIASMRFNNYQLTDDEYVFLQNRLLTTIKRKRVVKYQWFAGIAASLLLVCSVSVGIFLKQTSLDLFSEQSDITKLTIEQSQTEIEFFVKDEGKYFLPNEAKIELESSGEIKMQDAQIDSIPEADSKTIVSSAIPKTLNTLKVPNGRRSYVTLSDGTKVWVNAGTILLFPSVFEEDHRTIKVSGEIFLDVAKDEERPFIVQTSEMDIEVLGTSFNVTAYSQDNEQSVVLVNGHVTVNSKSGATKTIYPNDRLIVSDKGISVSKVDVYNYISWRDGVLQFEGQTLGYVVKRLSRYYNLQIECDSEIEEFVCLGKLVLFNDVVKVMETLESGFPISCDLKNNIIKLNKKTKK